MPEQAQNPASGNTAVGRDIISTTSRPRLVEVEGLVQHLGVCASRFPLQRTTGVLDVEFETRPEHVVLIRTKR